VVLHFHGTPITPRDLLPELAGRHFCVSHASPCRVEIVHEIGQSVMLDNGAYSFWKQSKPTDWPGYYRWCYGWLAWRTTWAVIPDVIDGDEDTNDRLIEQWPFGYRGAPVWHMHESLARLLRLCEEWPRVCIGSSGQFSDMKSTRWRRRMAQAMDTVCVDGRPITWLHLMRGLAFSGSYYPLASADSTNIAQNHAGSPATGRPPKPLSVMADRIDSLQCPSHWHSQPPQLEMVLQGIGTDSPLR
jgi:hypothetical protein